MNTYDQCRKQLSLLPIFLTTMLLLLLSACGAPLSSTNVTSSPLPPTPTMASAISPTSQPTPQYQFTAQDSGKTITYTVITTRITITLNAQKYPHATLKLLCNPTGALGSITNTPYVAPPLYAVRYEVSARGTCTIKNGAFLLTVKIVTPA